MLRRQPPRPTVDILKVLREKIKREQDGEPDSQEYTEPEPAAPYIINSHISNTEPDCPPRIIEEWDKEKEARHKQLLHELLLELSKKKRRGRGGGY